MSAPLPARCPLPDPPGDPAALARAVSGLGSAAFSAGLAGALLEPALAVHGWTGADADAAAAQVAASAAVAADLHRALTVAGDRLEEHAALWQRVLARLDRLREEQTEQYAVAAQRLPAEVPAADLEAGTTGADTPVVVALARQEADRVAEHRALLTAVAEDAAATAAVLARAGSTLGGAAGAADAERVTVALAARLPGWGERELAGLGTRAAGDLVGSGRLVDLAGRAADWLPYAAAPSFAAALLTALGTGGVEHLLTLLGTVAGSGEERPLAGLLATVAAATAGPAALPEQLTGLLDPADPDGAADAVAVGMGTVLAAPGAPAVLAAVWGGQVLRRERRQGAGAVARSVGTLPDPVVAAVDRLAAAGDPRAAAALLADGDTWSALLARSWPGGTDSLAAVLRLAGRAGGGADAVRAGLGALGHGLAPGSTDPVVVQPGTLTALGSALTDLLDAQVGVVLDLVRAAVATPGALPSAVDTGVRGLGLALSRADTPALDAAVRAALGAAGGPAAAGLAGGWTALRGYAHLAGTAAAYAAARGRAVDWDVLATGTRVVLAPLTGAAEEAGHQGLDALGSVLGADGQVDLRPGERSAVYVSTAAGFALGALQPAPALRTTVTAAAEDGFDAAAARLGRPAPTPYQRPLEMALHAVGLTPRDDPSTGPSAGPQPSVDAIEQVGELVRDLADDRSEGDRHRLPRRVSPGR